MTSLILHQLDDEVVAVGPILKPDGTYYVRIVGDTTTMVVKANHHVADSTGITYAGTLVEDTARPGQWHAVFTIPRGDLPVLSKKFGRVRVIDAALNQQTVWGDDIEVDPGRKAQRASVTTAPVLNLDAGPEVTAHLTDTLDVHDATAVSVVPFGTIAATNVQAALEEVATEAGTHPDLAGHDILGLATQADLDALSGTYVPRGSAAFGVAYITVATDGTDQAPVIRAAVAAAAVAGGGTVSLVGAGTATIAQDGANSYCLNLPGGVHLTSLFGQALTLQQSAGTDASVRLIRVTGTGNSVSHLTLDGNKAAQTVNEHRHGIFADNAVGTVVDDVLFQNFTGDGVYLYENTNRTAIRDSRFLSCARNGISFGGPCNGVRISGCTFEGIATQNIDSEPTLTTVQNIVVQGCVFGRPTSGSHSITVAGADLTAFPTLNWTITGNHFAGGIQVIWAKRVTITGNTFLLPSGSTNSAVYGFYGSNDVVVGNNVIDVSATAGLTGVRIASVSLAERAIRWTITGNTILASGASATIDIGGGVGITVQGNIVKGDGTAASIGILARCTFDIDGITINANTISKTARGVYLASSGANRIKAPVLTGNSFDGDGSTMHGALAFDASNYIDKLVMSGNTASAGVTYMVYDNWVSLLWLESGNYGTLDVGHYCGNGTPEAVVTAAIGSTFRRRDGGAGTALYVKQAAGSTGWVGK